MVALSLWSLVACHVFETAEVKCTSDEPCARGGPGSGENDTGDTADTAEEEPGTPVVGWVTSMSSGERGIVRAFHAESATVVAEWADLGIYMGAPWYDAESGAGVLIGVDAVHLLRAGGRAEYLGGGTGTGRYDLCRLGERIALALLGGVILLNADLSAGEEVVPYYTLGDNLFIGGNDRVAFVTDVAEGGPDLYKILEGGDEELVAPDYDTSATRGANVFVGPEDRPYACRTSGEVYSVDDLIAGRVKALVILEGGVDDVTSCAWDPGDSSWLFYSPTRGVFRVSEEGEAVQVHELSEGFAYDRVYWYGG